MNAALILSMCLVGLAMGDAPTPVPLLFNSYVADDSGQFSLSYLTGDGTTVQRQGVLKRNKEGTDNVLVQQGSYSYTAPDGTPVKVDYVADEAGFQPKSANIPVAPPLPTV